MKFAVTTIRLYTFAARVEFDQLVVNRHWARLVLGWVTVCGRVNRLGM